MSRLATVLVGLVLWTLPHHAGAATRYSVDATLDPAARTIVGTVDMPIENAARAPLDEVVLVLYPNRFSRAEPALSDLQRPYVYPREALVPGGMTIERLELRRGDAPSPLGESRTETIGEWPGTLLHVGLSAPLAPGEAATLRASFRTLLPERYGAFGVTDGNVIALGGWYPLLAARDARGAWLPSPDLGPVAVDGVLHAPAGCTVIAGQYVDAAGEGAVLPLAPRDADDADGDAAAGGPGLLASPRYRRHERVVDGASTVFLELPGRYARTFAPGRPPHATIVLDAVERVLRARPATLAPGPLVVAEAPLRLELTAPSAPGLAVVSDRVLRVDPLLRDFHERALAAAVYAALLHARVAARERPADAPWITEGVATALADRYLARARPRHRTVYDWIGLFNMFAIVDRFETSPKIPFSHTFFPESRHADELRDGVESFARDRPPGGTIFTKLRNEVGDAVFAATIDAYLAGAAPLRSVAAERAGRSLDWLFAQWTAPYPEPLRYAVREARLNETPRAVAGGASTDGAGAGAAASGATGYEQRLVLERTSSRPIREPVEVEVRGSGDRRVRLVWDDDARRAELVVATPWPARRVTLDPERRLLADTRLDAARPRPLQLVLDSADVTVTSSEFGISGLFVARQRYDYRKDVGIVAFYSDRSLGFTVGPRAHFGAPIDATSYRHNLYGFYTFAGLRRAFDDDSRPEIRTHGQLGGVGVRYDYSDEFWYDNPTDATKVRLFADLYDQNLGSSFDYADWGVRASAVRPLLTPRTLVAAELMTAFSSPTGSDRVPNQGRYSLGGDLAIRGIPVKARLGENLALARFELRQMLSAELDRSLFDVLVLRRAQLRLFVDTGHVEDRRESLYRLHDFAVGVGVGLAAFYDFMGFYPAVAYVALAQRVDRFDGVENRVQFLFGTRQAF